jgi:DNA polymerase I
LGFFGARWYSIECARSITAWGRFYIHKVIDKALKEGFFVLYSDTDSVFLTLDGKSKGDAESFAQSINSELPGLMELEYEGFYPSGIFVSAKIGLYGAKKKYALMSEQGMLKIKGFETVRRNWSFIAKDVQEMVLDIILRENDTKKALEYVKNVISDLRSKKIPMEKVVIHTQLQKDILDYAAKGPHVAVAQRLKNKGRNIGPGTLIKYVVTQGNDIIRNRSKLPEEVKENEYDADYYIHNQVIPSVERIFNVIGYKKEDLLETKEQTKLEGFF